MNPPAVEAKSLSSLTALASCPPSNPRHPSHVKNEPLVLYIARVPGSRDVFLSPMKPREKTVTAEDIQSSLYFVHADQSYDTRLTAPPKFHTPDYSDRNQNDQLLSTAGSIRRRPVPGTLFPNNDQERLQRRNVEDYAQGQGMASSNYNLRHSFDSNQYRQDSAELNTALRRSSDGRELAGTSLTLIRRDPTSGAQWNVASIEDPPVLNVSSSNSNKSTVEKKIGAPMYINILNPGYAKFLEPDRTDKPALPTRPADMLPQPEPLTQPLASGPGTAAGPNLTPELAFRRRLWMEGSQYLNGGFGHRKNSSYGTSISRSDSGEFNVQDPTFPSFLTREDQSYSTIQVSDRQTSFRGYVFTSPWSGRCEFTTGGSGGSLKCRHIFPTSQGAPSAAVQISELRFNLPNSSKSARSKGAEVSNRRPSLFNHDSSTEDNRLFHNRLGLTLSQENAGGGLGGKHAKLGKIILEDEGLKMMDLLVAANLALWWRAYERVTAN